MTTQFKPGDKVRNIGVNSDYFRLRVGDVYTVKGLTDSGRFVSFEETAGGWYPRDFELVEAATAETTFKAGDKVRIVRKVEKETGWRNIWVSPMDYCVGRPDVLTIDRVDHAGVYFTDGDGDDLGWPPSSLELVVEDAAPATPAPLRYADVQPGDVIKVAWELTVTERDSSGILLCTRPDGGTLAFAASIENLVNIELVSRKPTPLTIGDTVRCTLTDKIGTLTGTSEDRKYAWVVFGNGLRPKTRLLTELVRHTAA